MIIENRENPARQTISSAAGARRIPSLDGIRAVSISIVLFAHASLTAHFPPGLIRRPGMFLDGRLGVRVFFIISGFLITSLLLQERARTGGIRLGGFYARRVLRILPVYYVYILVVWLINIAGTNQMHGSTFLSAFTFTTELWGFWGSALSWPLEHTWSLSIEEQFYLTWPPLLAWFGAIFGGRIWVPLLLVLVPIMRAVFHNQPALTLTFATQGDSIAIGCLLALLVTRRKEIMSRFFGFHPNQCRLAAMALVYAHIFLAALLHRLNLAVPAVVFDALAPSLQNVAIAYLIGSFVTIPFGIGFALLNCQFMQWAGRLSYSLYIWQQLALVPIGCPTFPSGWNVASWLIQFPQNLGFAVVLAIISYYCLELPMLSLKKRFPK